MDPYTQHPASSKVLVQIATINLVVQRLAYQRAEQRSEQRQVKRLASQQAPG